MTLDLAGDHDLFDGLRQVVWRQAGRGTEIVIPGAVRREIVRPTAGMTDGTYRFGDVTWSLPRSALAFQPGAGDTLQDVLDGRTWTVQRVAEATLATRWRCECRDLILAENLRETITIERAEMVRDTDGSVRKAWTVLDVMPARIQPGTQYVADEHGAYVMQAGQDVYLMRPVTMYRFMRVRSAAGEIYNVTGARNQGRIDELMILETEANPWPSA